MTVRVPPPLDAESWDKLYKSLEEGPSKEEKEFLREALENKNNIRVIND